MAKFISRPFGNQVPYVADNDHSGIVLVTNTLTGETKKYTAHAGERWTSKKILDVIRRDAQRIALRYVEIMLGEPVGNEQTPNVVVESKYEGRSMTLHLSFDFDEISDSTINAKVVLFLGFQKDGQRDTEGCYHQARELNRRISMRDGQLEILQLIFDHLVSRYQ